MQESEAIALLKKGDMQGLTVLIGRYQYQAVRAATLITRDRSLAEDIVQSAFLRAYERIQQFDSGRPFGPWFLRGVVNDALKQAQRGAKQVRFDATPGEERAAWEQLVDAAADPARLLEQGELRAVVADALNQLTPLQRAAIVQRYYLGLSETEMARTSGSSAGAIKLRLFAARERLRRLLKPASQDSVISD